jgi:hypothetical protein
MHSNSDTAKLHGITTQTITVPSPKLKFFFGRRYKARLITMSEYVYWYMQ